MARGKVTERRRVTKLQNMGANRNRSMRNNARVNQNQGTFQGGIGLNQGVTPQTVAPPPQRGAGVPQNQIQCPTGLKPSTDPTTGAQICVQDRPNISDNVPVNNAKRAINPGGGRPVGGNNTGGY